MRHAFAMVAPLLLAGCTAPDAVSASLSAAGGDGDFFVALTVVPDGGVDRYTAWWAAASQEFDTTPYTVVTDFDGVVIKNDVVLDDDVPVRSDGERVLLLWSSEEAGSVGRRGDTYEFHVLDAGDQDVVASATLRITR